MERIYSNGVKKDVTFFIGTEVEHTPAYGLKTLFVVGLCDIDQINHLVLSHNCEHIYLGANQSFNPGNWINGDYELSDKWNNFIKQVLDLNLPTTLDFDIKHVEWVIEGCYSENDNFIPQISVKIPYLEQLRYNATLKIDDKDFAASNPGVWCHSLHNLLDRKLFTPWQNYKKDQPL